jgi:hypothetical protein
MTTDPAVIAAMNGAAKSFATADPDLGRWIGAIAEKATEGMSLNAYESDCFNSFARAVTAAAQTASVQVQAQSLATLSAAPSVALSLSAAEATSLAALLVGQTDPLLVGIALKIVAAQASDTLASGPVPVGVT